MSAAENPQTSGAGRVPTEYRISGHVTAGGEAAVTAANMQIELDAAWGRPPSGLPGPAQLLAAAFAACLLKNLARAGDLLGFEYDDAHVEVTARRQDSPPKFVEIAYTLRVTTDESPRRVELVHLNLRRYGTVYNTLAAVCDVHGSMEAVARSAELKPG
ncbi:MAG TPA: OsmC family protein [Jiangellaceae bacterium]